MIMIALTVNILTTLANVYTQFAKPKKNIILKINQVVHANIVFAQMKLNMARFVVIAHTVRIKGEEFLMPIEEIGRPEQKIPSSLVFKIISKTQDLDIAEEDLSNELSEIYHEIKKVCIEYLRCLQAIAPKAKAIEMELVATQASVESGVIDISISNYCLEELPTHQN